MLNADNLGGATLEILTMLLVAFLLGYLLRFFIGGKWKKHYENLESENLTLTNNLASSNSKIKNLEDSNNYLRKELDDNKRSLAIEKSKNVNGQGKPVTTSDNALMSGASGKSTSLRTGSGALKTKASSQKKINAKKSSASSPKLAKTKKSTGSKKRKSSKKDDLKVVEGIGPKIQELFNAAGIYSYDDLASSRMTELRKILKDAGSRYRMHDPKTWPRQARMASQGKWKKLEELQDSLKGGKKV